MKVASVLPWGPQGFLFLIFIFYLTSLIAALGVPSEVVKAALVQRQNVSDIPECALNISLPAMMELNCPDAACICKSEPFFQDQCTKIKSECSPHDAEVAIKVGQAICAEAGVSVECADTPIAAGEFLSEKGDKNVPGDRQVHTTDDGESFDISPDKRDDLNVPDDRQGHTTIERRHSWAFVCDSPQINPQHQREFTQECTKKGYQCTERGRMVSKGNRGDTLCLAACRCVSVYSNCAPSWDRPSLGIWVDYCGVGKAKADDAGDKSSHGEPPDLSRRSNVADDDSSHGEPPDISRRDVADPEPVLGPWEVWCADADSVHDPLVTGNCQRVGKYGCDASGIVHRSKALDECEMGCLCVQEECNLWDIECGAPLEGTNPLVAQCKQDQECTMDGAYVRKDGIFLDPKSTCGSSCKCAYSATRCG